jgi:hypothetical protein
MVDSLAAAHRRLSAFAAAGTLLILASCSSDDGLGKRYPVSGAVTYNGKHLEKGLISFIPDDPKGGGVGATGEIKDGSYTLSTGGNQDGARAGKYKVTITSREDSLDMAKEYFAKDTKGVDPGYLPGRYVAKAAAHAKSLIPIGYGDVRTTNLGAEVKAQSSNPIDFKLSDAEAPTGPTQTTTKAGAHKQ